MHPRDQLLQLAAAPRKSFSQNFLTSPHWAENLVHFVLSKPSDEIWEIGPGLGALTAKILEKSPVPVRVFEIDRKLSENLRVQFPSAILHEGDFLKMDLAKLAEGKRISVLSNLPYHISSRILFALSDIRPNLVRMVLTFQKEFADRLTAIPSTKQYGSLSILAQSLFNMESIGTIPPKAFYPAPDVSSEAVLFEGRNIEEATAAQLKGTLQAAFKYRRKKLRSNLKRAFPKAPLDQVLDKMSLGENVRPEELTRDQFLQIASAIYTP